MSLALTLFLAACVYAAVVILVIGVCVSAADADRLADRVLGPGSSSSDEFQLGLLAAMDEASGPPAERRRG